MVQKSSDFLAKPQSNFKKSIKLKAEEIGLVSLVKNDDFILSVTNWNLL